MSLLDQINADLKTAIKNQEKDKLTPLRAVKAAILLIQTEGSNRSLTPDDEVALLTKLVKQRRESYEIYTQQNREDLATIEQQEIEVISVYLPEALSEEELENGLRAIIAETGASSMKDMGRVMGMASKRFAGRADGKQIANLVKKILTS